MRADSTHTIAPRAIAADVLDQELGVGDAAVRRRARPRLALRLERRRQRRVYVVDLDGSPLAITVDAGYPGTPAEVAELAAIVASLRIEP